MDEVNKVLLGFCLVAVLAVATIYIGSHTTWFDFLGVKGVVVH